MRVRLTCSARYLKLQQTIAAFVPVLIVTLSITGFMWAQKEVTVVVDGRALHVQTQGRDVASVLEQAGIAVDHRDLVTPSADADIASGDTVVVRHSVPVTLDLGGGRVQLDVVGETVADALVAAGADPSANPAVTPALDDPLEPGMTIQVPDVFMRVTQDESPVSPGTELKPDPSLPRGTRRVVADGTPGRLLKVYRVLVTNGVEGAPSLSAERVVVQAEPRVIAVGTAVAPIAVVNRPVAIPGPPRGGRRLLVEATGYSARQPGLDDTTATGARARRGVIAVDPNVIPLGTRVYVPGYGYAVAADTGGSIKGNRIDLCFDTVDEAIRWGRRTVTITLVD